MMLACGSEQSAPTPQQPDTGVDAPSVTDVPCGGACGLGTECVSGMCILVDAGTSDASAEDRAQTPDASSLHDATEDRPGVVDVTVPVDTGPTCPSGETLCAARCVNTQSDPANCGGCDMRCGMDPTRHLVARCAAGLCMTVCEQHWGDCNPAIDGCETELRSAGNCGTCGRMCARTQACVPPSDGGAFRCTP